MREGGGHCKDLNFSINAALLDAFNLYSLTETGKDNSLGPFTYLRHLFTELPTAKTVDDYEKLLPWNIDPAALSMD